MALLIYSNGMDVRVATVENNIDIGFIEYLNPNIAPLFTKIKWEYCNDESEVEKLRRENEILRKKLIDVYKLTDDAMKRMNVKA